MLEVAVRPHAEILSARLWSRLQRLAYPRRTAIRAADPRTCRCKALTSYDEFLAIRKLNDPSIKNDARLLCEMAEWLASDRDPGICASAAGRSAPLQDRS